MQFYALQTQELFFIQAIHIVKYLYLYLCTYIYVCIYIYMYVYQAMKYNFVERNILFWLDKKWKSNIPLNFAHLIHFTQTKFNFEHSISISLFYYLHKSKN